MEWCMSIHTAEYEKILEDKKRTGDDYIVGIIHKGTIMNEKYRKIFDDKSSLYYFLRANIIRGRMINDKLGLYKRYYQRGFLVCSFTIKELMHHINTTNYKIRKWIKELDDANIIKIERGWIKDKNSPNVFILGMYQHIDGSVIERFYLDDVLED
jgi:hypothetical protein